MRYNALVMRNKLWMKSIQVISRFIKNPRPVLMVGQGSSTALAHQAAGTGYERALLVTDQGLRELGLHKTMVAELKRRSVDVTVFSDVSPNPTVHEMNRGTEVAKACQADVVIAFGGGSAMDAAKIIAAKVTNNKPIAKMEGAFRLRKQPLPIVAVPTTAGTGSEVTIGAVVSDPESRRKYTVADAKLVPKLAALDPDLTRDLPPAITAATGMDALTHAIEAFVATRASEETRDHAKTAVSLIFENLQRVFNNGHDMEARESMALASYYAGMAISDAGVGYVHAFAHQLGGLYHISHGIANAALLPEVLSFSKEQIKDQLAELARLIGLDESGESTDAQAEAFILSVRKLNASLNLPETLPEIRTQDKPLIVQRAIKEALDLFAAPKHFTYDDGMTLIERVME